FVFPEDLERMKTYHRERRNNPSAENTHYEFRFINRSGEIKYCINNVRLIPGTTLSVASVVDITDRKIAEEDLAESEQRYRSVVEDQTEFICRFLPDGTHAFVNEAYCRYFGFNRDEIIGKKFNPEIPEKDQKLLISFYKSLTPSHPAGSIEHRIVMPDGTIRWQFWNERAIFDDKGSVIEYQSVGRDITDRKNAEETLHLAKRKLQILSGITRHDILNRIMVLEGYLDFAEEISSNPKQTDYLNLVKNEVTTIKQYIEFTREYEKLGIMKPAWLDVNKIIEDLKNKDLLIRNECKKIMIYADPMIEKVFGNLMDNTIRHVKNKAEVLISCMTSENCLTIIWKDNGPGIPDSEKESIFEKGVGKNTGFGLFLSREILSITGIKIIETGVLGEGARFEIIVPKDSWKTL
ncbi:MAG: PAS domain-containing sensor histidine kinase, partial [Methanomicrobiaceae archaeon]|nr:PAS domain-containing sensor histidine kinase [Methanomicrobiaceae archaeon]